MLISLMSPFPTVPARPSARIRRLLVTAQAGPRNCPPHLAAFEELDRRVFSGVGPAPVFRCGRRSFPSRSFLRNGRFQGFDSQNVGMGLCEGAALADLPVPVALRRPWLFSIRKLRAGVVHQVELRRPFSRLTSSRRRDGGFEIEVGGGDRASALFQGFQILRL